MLIHQAAQDDRLSRAAVRCLVALDTHYNYAQGAAWPTQQTLAGELGSTQPRVSVSIRELAEAGYIVARRRRYDKVYCFLPPKPQERRFVVVQDVTLPVTSEAPDIPEPVCAPGVQEPRYTGPGMSDIPARIHRTKDINQETGTTDTTPERKRERAPKKPPAVKPHRLPADWAPPQELLDWAVNDLKIPRPVVDTQTANFQAYFWDNPKVCRPGWVKSFQTWMRNASKGGIRDAVTPWERAQGKSTRGNGITNRSDLIVPKQAATDFGYGRH